jgi:amino-acid N-acetyltransferase
MAEIASLYTLTRFLGEGVGGHLVAHAVERAESLGLRAVFACTTMERVGAFFLRNGFREVPQEDVPASKWRGYEPSRRAKVRCFRRELTGG